MKKTLTPMIHRAYSAVAPHRKTIAKIARSVVNGTEDLGPEDALLVQLAVRELIATELSFGMIAQATVSRIAKEKR